MVKFNKKLICNICGKDTQNSNGWHLEYNLDFCSNHCVAVWIEKTEKYIDKYFSGLKTRGRKPKGRSE